MNCYKIGVFEMDAQPQTSVLHVKAQTAEDAYYITKQRKGRFSLTGIEACNEHLKAPPIGVTPHKIVKEHRIVELMDAMKRYIEVGRPITPEWRNELHLLLSDRDQKPIDFNPDWFKNLA